jgi:hypothetical protein
MPGQKTIKPVKPYAVKEPWPKKDTPPFTKGRSQDADRHSKSKHPVSDK